MDATREHGRAARLDFGEFYGRILHSAQGTDVAVREIADLPLGSVPRHAHDHAHFCLVISGHYQTATRNFTGQCHARALLYHPADTTHEDRFLDTGGRTLMVSLGADLLEALGDPRLSRESIALDDAGIGFPGSRLRRELRATDQLSLLSMEGLALEMISCVLARADRSDARRPRWLSRAVGFLRESATAPARVVDVANAVGVHPVHLARVFRRLLGLSPGEYLRRVRVREAMGRIERTAQPHATIAIRCGFCDQSEMAPVGATVATSPGAFSSLSSEALYLTVACGARR